MSKKLFSLIGCLSIIFNISAQEINQQATQTERPSNKGRMYIFWGWNRSWYTNSSIHFTGSDYDFIIHGVHATDRQTPFSIDPYFNPSRITIPQTNVRLGYFINDKIDISLGYDHMKYVMVQHQFNKVSGNINHDTPYDGKYNNDWVKMDYEFLKFEHTDGLNYIDIEITRNDDLFEAFNISSDYKKVQLTSLIGFGAGVVFPRSNVTLLDGERYDEFHVAGYGFSGKAGLNLILYKYFFLRGEFKYGFIDMPDIRTTPDKSDKASQFFFFRQINFCFGFTFHPFSASK